MFNRFFYSSGDGDDVIIGHSQNDTFYVTSGTIDSVYGSGSNVIIKVGDGSITVKDAINKPVFVANSYNILSGYIYDGSSIKNIIFSDSEYVTVNGSDSSDYIYNSPYSNGKSGYTTVIAGAGNDTIFHDAIYSRVQEMIQYLITGITIQ